MKNHNKLISEAVERINSHQFKEAVETIQKLEGKFPIKDPVLQVPLLVSISKLYQMLGNRKQDISFITKSLEVLEKIDIKKGIIISDYHYTLARSLLLKFNFLKRENPSFRYTYENLSDLQTAKSIYLQLFWALQNLKDNKSKKLLDRVSSELSTCILEFSRYAEAFYFFDQPKNSSLNKANAYHRALAIETVVSKTCANGGVMAFYEALLSVREAKTGGEGIDKNISDHLIALETQYLKKIQELEFSEEQLEKDRQENLIEFEGFSKYRKFCIEKHLGINEHSIFCSCGLSKMDDLTIRTNHQHTHKDWILPFENAISRLKTEFDSARRAYYQSQNCDFENVIEYHSLPDGIIESYSAEMLRSAFRLSYGVLDKIASLILQVFEIELNPNQHIYFHRFWRQKAKNGRVLKELLEEKNNFHVYALNSIANDLQSANEYAALSEFKTWRDSMEHNLFYLIKDGEKIDKLKSEFPTGSQFAHETEFHEKCFYLLHLCRSAIFSLVFLIRMESKHR